MKNTVIKILLFASAISFSQNPVVLPLYNTPEETPNAYYKDLENELNRFEGTWKYENGNNSLTVKFIKKEEMFVDYGDISYYVDFLVGEYRYVENGIEKINTLSNLLINHPNPYQYSMRLKVIIRPNPGVHNLCAICGPNNIMMAGGFSDPLIEIENVFGRLKIADKFEDGLQKMYFYLSLEGLFLSNDPTAPTSFTVPTGKYVLIKQP
jgi:hypothetical protein